MGKDSLILVLGGSGMVGSAILRNLWENGYKNLVATYHSSGPKDVSEGIEWKRLDLRNQVDVRDFFFHLKPDYVFLAAARVGGIMANNTYKADFIYDNIQIACNVIHSSYEVKVKKLINFGSSCIYPKHAPQPLREEYLLTGPLEPTNEPYAIAKIAAIKLCRYFNEQYGTNFISLMPSNLYGINDNFHLKNSHVLPALIRKFHLAKLLQREKWEDIEKDFLINKDLKEYFSKKGGNLAESEIIEVLGKLGIFKDKVVLWGTGKPYREFLYVDDLAEAARLLLEKYDYKDVGEFINVGSGQDLMIAELAHLVAKVVGFQGKIEFDSKKPDGTPRKVVDISRIKFLGWKPLISLEDGIKKTYNWYLERK